MDDLKDALHASWLDQLNKEYHQICHNYRVKLDPPILEISTGRKCLGSWSDGHRILRISAYLILHHPWHVTLNVLKHEMGHQICSELLGDGNAGHGPLFRKACRMIGLDEAFCLENADSDPGLADALDPKTHERGRYIIEKVRKLLALGKSDNEHEAALAMRRAGEILTRHRLRLEALEQAEGFSHVTIDTRRRVMPAYRKSICALLQECFGVRVVLSSLYDPILLRSHKTVELLGRNEETAIAGHCWHFLEHRLASLWQANKGRFGGNPLRAKNSYFLGVVAGFRQSLGASTSRTSPDEAPSAAMNTLPIYMEQQLSDFVAFHYPRLRRSTGGATTLNSRAYNEAVAAGRKLTLRRPVGERESRPPLQLTQGAQKK